MYGSPRGCENKSDELKRINKKLLNYMKQHNKNTGQALVTLLVFTAVAMIVISASVAMIIITSTGSYRFANRQQAHLLAESGVENALMQLLRNPSYSGETLTTTEGTATISMSGTNPKIIRSSAVVGTVTTVLNVTVADTSGMLDITSWEEE